MKKFALGFAVLGLLAAACSSSSSDGAKDPDGADTATATDTAAPATTDTAAPATTDTAAPESTDTAAPAGT